MNPMEIILKQKADEASRTALSQALRRKKDIGMLSQLSGDPILSKFGGSYSGEADEQAKLYAAQREKADQRNLTKSYYDQLQNQYEGNQEYRGKVLQETMKHNRAMEEAAMARASQTAGKTPPMGVQKRAEEVVGTVEQLNLLGETFKDEYASEIGFGEGDFSNMMGKTPLGTQGQKDQSNWWGMYRQMYELGARNQLFGSALTDTEQKAWRQANISPNSSPDQIRKGIAIMQRVAAQKAALVARSHATAGYKPEWVMSVYGPIDDFLTQTPGVTDSPELPAGGGGNEGVVKWDQL